MIRAIDYCFLGEEEVRCFALAKRIRRSLSPPILSKFRIVTVISYNFEGSSNIEMCAGTNGECCHMSGSLCAERAAILKLRVDTAGKRIKIRGIYMTSDSETSPVLPGFLCREFLLAYCPPKTPVYITTSSKKNITIMFELETLYPFPPIENICLRDDVSFFKELCSVLRKASPKWLELYETLKKKASGLIGQCYPRMFVAGVLWTKETKTSNSQQFLITSQPMFQVVEYGATLDPVCGLFAQIKSYHDSGDFHPVVLMIVDNSGFLHAPGARARSLLSQHTPKFLNTRIPLVDYKNRVGPKIYVNKTLKHLVPEAPVIDFKANL